MKRILAMLLCVIMVVGLLPATAFAAEEDVDYLFLATDRHANTSVIGNIINNMEKTIGENELDYLGLGGDMVGSGNTHPAYNSSTVLAEVTGATSSLSADNVDIVAGIHDMNVTDDAGIVLPYKNGGAKIYEGDKFYVYGVEEYCISDDSSSSNWSGEAQKFVNWANGADVDKSKVIVVLSHYPLHAKRSDNDGAYYWHQALNTVATGAASGDSTVERNVLFFHGHNHTVDSSEYVYNVGDTMSIQNGSSTTSDTIYYTYATAGYLNQNSKATLMAITDDAITLTKYDTSSSSAMTTVTRAVTETEVTLSSIAVTTMPTKTAYTVGDTFDKTGLVVTATYSDGSTKEVEATLSEPDMTAAGTYTVTATYEGLTATFEITVTEPSTKPTVNTVECWDNTNQVLVKATGLGLTAVKATNVTGGNAKCDEVFTANGYMAFDIALTGLVDGNSVKYSISVVPDLDVTNLELYYIDDQGELIPVECELTTDELNNVYVEFTTDKVGTFVYGSPVVPEGYALTSLTLANIPTDVFLGTSLALDETAEITATYTMDGAEDFVRKLTIYDYDYTNFTGLDVNVIGKQTVTFTFEGVTTTLDINVWGKSFEDEATGVTVAVGEGEYGVTSASVAESTNTHVAAAITEYIEGDSFEAYDITLNFTEGYATNEAEKTVTLPIPEGVENPAVYYVSDDGATVTDMKAKKTEDGKSVTFTTDHFSTYVVGESTEITVPAPEDATGNGEITTTEKKTIYKLVSSLTAGEEYLVVSRNSAGSGYGLAGNTTGQSVTVKAADDISSVVYIEDKGNALEWTASSGWSFTSGSYDLGYSNGLSFSTEDEWTFNNNRLYQSVRSGRQTYTYYLRCNEGTWSASTTQSNVYLYEKQTVEVETTTNVSGTYSIAGTPAEVSKVVVEGTTATLGSTLTFTPTSGTATTTENPAGVTYTVVEDGDPNDVISNISGNTVTFSGVYGKALVKVSYTTSFGEVTNYITVIATEPVYTIDITHDDDADGTYTSVTEVITVKGETAMAAGYQLGADLYYEDADGKEEAILDSTKLTWVSNNTAVATVDANGKVTFKGEGSVQITAYYAYADGKSVTDVVTFSVSKNAYVVPGDGTEDFPEYPNEGAVRFDKHADAVGNFSETGIAKVELSMTGVPYTTGSEIDVVLMLDMTGSMDDVTSSTSEPTGYVRIDATIAASKAFIETIVKNEDGSYNGNRVGVYVFNKNGAATLFDFGTVDSDTELAAVNADLETIKDDHFASGGTPYDDGLKECYDVLKAAKTDGVGNNRQQFTVFMTDGVPTSYAYVNGTTYGTHSSASAIAGMLTSSDNYATRDTDYKYEYYSTEMKKAGVTVYSVGVGLENTNNAWSGSATQCLNLASRLLNDISGPGGETTQPDAVSTSTLSKKDEYFFSVEDSTAAADMTKVFSNIAQKILEAATDVVVEDKVGSNYSINFGLPSGVEAAKADGMSEFYLQVVEYQLDANKERTGDPTVLENFTFNSNGSFKSHTVDGTACSSCSHVTVTNGTVTKIDGTYFNYENKGDDGEILTWEADKLTTTELAFQYFVHLDNSTGTDVADQIAAGSYYTNDYANLTYTNYKGNRVQQEFPVPQMTWKGAQVTYTFYLVNEAGQPVNRAGKVVPFAEAVYVTTPITESVTWYSNEGVENMLAENLFASANVPEVYSLYDTDAYYAVRVYQTEGVDEEAKNYNYFQIDGSDTIANKATTKVFNTKSGPRYDAYGVYSEQNVGTVLNTTDENGDATTVTTTVQTTDINYADTTVAFAVVWKPRLETDTVVIDYGLDVVINVSENDNLASGVVGVCTDAPSDIKINEGTYPTSTPKVTAADVYIDANGDNTKELKIGTATVENMTSVRFSLDKANGTQMNKPALFYYESDCNYYSYDSSNNATLNTSRMYSSVIVIPATTVYYEDDYVTLSSYTLTETQYDENGKVAKDENGKLLIGTKTKDATSAWTTAGSALTATQAVDRPGFDKISAAYDANNAYGYDAAYSTMSEYSMGSAAQITVSSAKTGEASFTFYGTGFDIIGLTSNTTGTLMIDVYAGATATGTPTTYLVDTYYGYTLSSTDINGDGELNDWVISDNTPGTLYQVPVMKVSGLTYGQYTVVLTASYGEAFDHKDSGSYDLYLDAIRIYDPVAAGTVVGKDGEGDGAEDVYIEDIYAVDNEGWPVYEELRNNVISASNYQVTENEDGTVTVTGNNLSGAIFIDCSDATTSIADYVSYGPNNELYLAKNQAIAFNVTVDENVADVQLGIKVGNGNTVTYEINGDSYTTNSATDLYYSILKYAKAGTVTIKNVSGGILSLTNIKVTHTSAPASGISLLSMDADSAGYALMSLRRTPVVEEEVPETTVPEETETETTETEATEPETTVPEETEPEETTPEPTVPEETDPAEDVVETITNAVKNVVNKIASALSNLFGRWFR